VSTLGTIAIIRTNGLPRVLSWIVVVAAVFWFGMIEER
jgi:hypothetical protein